MFYPLTVTTMNKHHQHYYIVESALDLIQQQPTSHANLEQVAEHCAISEDHLQQVFIAWAGINLTQFLRTLSHEQIRKRMLDCNGLQQSQLTVDRCGYNYLPQQQIRITSISPAALKSQGAGLHFIYGLHSSPFGQCFIVATKYGIYRLDFIESSQLKPMLHNLQQQWPKAVFSCDQQKTAGIIDALLAGTADNTLLKLWVKASPFQLKVWEALLQIPLGAVTSYAAIAQSIGQPSAARATGTAISQNSVALLIPCHRVVQAAGNCGNYRWGPARKQAILGWEAAHRQSTSLAD
jgi:AraC family transcriptional regulator of adaptative response/methylated-DNA-[protein]-cysteine methyltransferase